MPFKVPNIYRVRTGDFRSDDSDKNNGLFKIPLAQFNKVFACVASDGEGWDHVSVSLPNRCPTWEEMCEIKKLFWDESDWVVQYHPAASDYVNMHPYCLHMWRPTKVGMPTPPKWMVGI